MGMDRSGIINGTGPEDPHITDAAQAAVRKQEEMPGY